MNELTVSASETPRSTPYERPAHLPPSAEELRAKPPIERTKDRKPGEVRTPDDRDLADAADMLEEARVKRDRYRLVAAQDPPGVRRRRLAGFDEQVAHFDGHLGRLRQRTRPVSPRPARTAPRSRAPQRSPRRSASSTTASADPPGDDGGSDGDGGDGDGGDGDGGDGDGDTDPVSRRIRELADAWPPFSPGQRQLLSRLLGGGL